MTVVHAGPRKSRITAGIPEEEYVILLGGFFANGSETSGKKKLTQIEYLTSWKEIAGYMGAGIRTVQRYERELGLPIRRPTGKLRGAVMATKAELDAWVAAAPFHKTFELSRADRATKPDTEALRRGIAEMRTLHTQMNELRVANRSAMQLLIDKVNSMFDSRSSCASDGYEFLGMSSRVKPN